MVDKPRDIGQALIEMGVTVVRQDSEEVHGLCPEHEKRTGEPQRNSHWSVNRESGYHNCFSCGYGGAFVELVMDVVGLDPFFAARWVRKHGLTLMDPADLEEFTSPAKRALTEEGRARVEMGEARLALFYRPPLEVMEARSLDPETAEFYDVLWNLEEQGWVIPIRLPDGTLMGWQFKSKRYFNNYPNNVPKGQCLFGLEMLDEDQTAILVESPLDCLRLRSAGVYGAVSSFGAGVTDIQMRRLLEKTSKVIVALDNDREGKLQTQLLCRGESKRGKIVRKGWAARFGSLQVFNYGDSKAKDPGDMSDDEILWGVENAQTPAALFMGRVKTRETDVHRNAQAVPRGGGRPSLRQGTATGRLRDGTGKDRRDNLRRRGTR